MNSVEDTLDLAAQFEKEFLDMKCSPAAPSQAFERESSAALKQRFLKELGSRKCRSSNWDYTELSFTVSSVGVAMITFNESKSLETPADGLLVALEDALVELHESTGSVRVVIFRGQKAAFCSGLDVWQHQSSQEVVEAKIQRYARLF